MAFGLSSIHRIVTAVHQIIATIINIFIIEIPNIRFDTIFEVIEPYIQGFGTISNTTTALFSPFSPAVLSAVAYLIRVWCCSVLAAISVPVQDVEFHSTSMVDLLVVICTINNDSRSFHIYILLSFVLVSCYVWYYCCIFSMFSGLGYVVFSYLVRWYVS